MFPTTVLVILITVYFFKCTPSGLAQTVQAAEFSRYSRKEGFHRDLYTEVVLHQKDIDVNVSECWIVFTEVLPQGLYVDLDQIGSNGKAGFPKVYSTELIDIEKPAHESPSHVIHVYSNLTQERGGVYRFYVVLPVHLRYHRASETRENQHAEVIIGHPRIHLECKSQNEDQKNDVPLMNSKHIKDVRFKSADQHMIFEVPIGQKKDTVLVVIATLFFTIIGCLWIAAPLLKTF